MKVSDSGGSTPSKAINPGISKQAEKHESSSEPKDFHAEKLFVNQQIARTANLALSGDAKLTGEGSASLKGGVDAKLEGDYKSDEHGTSAKGGAGVFAGVEGKAEAGYGYDVKGLKYQDKYELGALVGAKADADADFEVTKDKAKISAGLEGAVGARLSLENTKKYETPGGSHFALTAGAEAGECAAVVAKGGAEVGKDGVGASAKLGGSILAGVTAGADVKLSAEDYKSITNIASLTKPEVLGPTVAMLYAKHAGGQK